jgi:VIT1/CCC1 family predicted Fe2+/Mn2+ transporter
MDAAAEEGRPERHRSGRAGWLRAAVLGAEDGLVSTASLMIGVVASSASTSAVVVAGAAGIAAGAFSMAAGEYVSVSSQADAEKADVAVEKRELASDPAGELRELAAIYRRRGLSADLADKVAAELMAGDRLKAHLRDELGLSASRRARPIQAAAVSAGSFTALALLPMLALLASGGLRIVAMAAVSLLGLACLGALGAKLGGAPVAPAALRVSLGGGLAMGATALVGYLVGAATAA